jgi:hypothetical protein
MFEKDTEMNINLSKFRKYFKCNNHPNILLVKVLNNIKNQDHPANPCIPTSFLGRHLMSCAAYLPSKIHLQM